MARERKIKPGFFKNEYLGELDPLARLLFAGLWCWADRMGRFEYRPKKLKADILPYDNCDGDDLMQNLVDKGFVVRYEVNGEQFGQIVNWKKHQSPHPAEVKSKIMGPDEVKSNLDLSCKPVKTNLEVTAITAGTNLEATDEQRELHPIPSCTSIPSVPSYKTGTGGTDARDSEIAEVVKLYQDNIHPLTGSIETDELHSLVDDFSAKWVEAAIREAVKNGVRKINYIRSILDRWRSSGTDEPWKGQKKTGGNIRAPARQPESRLAMVEEAIRGFDNVT